MALRPLDLMTDQPSANLLALPFARNQSYFMADGSAHWNSHGQTGNPTMSKAVNKLIAEITKQEAQSYPTMSKAVNKLIAEITKRHKVWKQGKSSNAKRDMKRAKFKKTLSLLRNSNGFTNLYKIPTTMLMLQFHLIGQTDNICNLETANLHEHKQFRSLHFKPKWPGARRFMKSKRVRIKSFLVPMMQTFVC
jgi:hypothetical protein